MYILGLNAFHGDSSACLLKDGVVINATEEERFRRIKHWAGFPSEAIKFCLNDAGIKAQDLDYMPRVIKKACRKYEVQYEEAVEAKQITAFTPPGEIEIRKIFEKVGKFN